MGKRVGESYDPKLRKTELGSKLYSAWKRVRKYPHVEEWDNFPVFYEWAIQSEFVDGAWLRRIDDDQPFSPDNCEWYTVNLENDNIPPGWADEWNKTVNRIRKYYGMPPLEGTEYGD